MIDPNPLFAATAELFHISSHIIIFYSSPHPISIGFSIGLLTVEGLA